MLPRVHPGTLRRARLLEMLDDDGGGSLTVLNATVGYGKTTLVRSWCVERPEAVIWVTLDSADDDPVRLWAHLATAVERLGEGLGRRALSALGVRGATVETAVDELMNGLVAYGSRVSIVLDDVHAVSSDASVRSIAHAIERLPANARLLASTRSDPAIGVARLRARRVLTEVRARELAFTVDETRELVAREGIGLSSESVELLVERTEGWPAGLYLAALWLRDLHDPNGGVRDFAGSARQVGDYLADEVLTALAPEIRDFLLRTSVLRRFTPELCDAVLGREDSAAVLADLARSNMFLVALDARGEWYRYHHLFGEVLQLELGRETARELRRRAAAWCRAHGLVEEAIEYAAAAGDAEMVAELLIERHLEFIWGGRLGQFLGWVRWLPAELLVQHPVLPDAGAVAAALLAAPEVEVQRLLAVAERARRERPELWLPYLEAGVELARSEVIEGGDVGAAVGHARRAVAAAQEGADVLSVERARVPDARTVFCRRARRDATGRAADGRATRRARRHPTSTSEVSGYSRSSTPSKDEPRARRRGLGRRSASRASTSRRTRGSRHRRIWGWRWRASRSGASTTPSARRYAVSVCGARHNRRLATRTRCSYSPRCGWRDRAWRGPRVTSSAPNARSRGFRIRVGCRRSPPRSSRPSWRLERTPAAADRSKSPARPSSPSCEASRPVCPDARSPRSCTSRSIPSRATRASCTANSVRHRKPEAVARAEALGLLDPGQSPG